MTPILSTILVAWFRGVEAGLARVHCQPSTGGLPAPIRFDALHTHLSKAARKDLAFHLGALAEPGSGGLVFSIEDPERIPPGANLPGLPLACAAAAHEAAGRGAIFEAGPAVFHGELHYRQSSSEVLVSKARGTFIAAEQARDAGLPLVVDSVGFFEARMVERLQIAPLMSDRVAPFAPPLVVSEGLPSGVGPEGADTAGLPDSLLEPFCEAIREPGARVLLLGSAGSPKTMLARRAAMGLCGAPTGAELAESARIFSMSGIDVRTVGARPFRAPHHTTTAPALVGGGSPFVRPGEVSLAHNGVLYLDDVIEFSRMAIESLAFSINKGRTVLSRADSQTVMPSAPRALICSARAPTSDGERKRLDRYVECLGLTVLDLDTMGQ